MKAFVAALALVASFSVLSVARADVDFASTPVAAACPAGYQVVADASVKGGFKCVAVSTTSSGAE